MGYPTKVQWIKRKKSAQWYINFPAAIAQAMEFERGETVEWSIENKECLMLRRQKVPSAPKKIKRMTRAHIQLIQSWQPAKASCQVIPKNYKYFLQSLKFKQI